MRMALGLAGILVTLGVIVWIMSVVTLPATKQALDTKKRITPQIEQMAGHTTQGTRAADTIKVDVDSRGGKMVGVLVTDVTEGGAMDTYFGLKKGDSITEIGPLPVADMGSASEAKDYLVAEYQRSGKITVTRGGLKKFLPTPTDTPAAAAAAAEAAAKKKSAASPGSPGGTDATKDALQKQLDAIPGVR
jgi:hypothetical protein